MHAPCTTVKITLEHGSGDFILLCMHDPTVSPQPASREPVRSLRRTLIRWSRRAVQVMAAALARRVLRRLLELLF